MSSELQAPNKCHKSHSQCAKLFSVFPFVCQFDLLPAHGDVIVKWQMFLCGPCVWRAIFHESHVLNSQQGILYGSSPGIRVTGPVHPRRREANAWSLINSHIICFIKLPPSKNICPCRWEWGKSPADTIVMHIRVIPLLLVAFDFWPFVWANPNSILPCRVQIWDAWLAEKLIANDHFWRPGMWWNSWLSFSYMPSPSLIRDY